MNGLTLEEKINRLELGTDANRETARLMLAAYDQGRDDRDDEVCELEEEIDLKNSECALLRQTIAGLQNDNL